MEPGEKLWYLHAGYGFTDKVPAVFVKYTLSRITIDVDRKVGGWKRIHVTSEKVERRAE